MGDIVIQVEDVSKRYRIGLKEEMHDTFVGAISNFVKRPVNNLRRLRKLSIFNEDGHGFEDIVWALKDVSFEVKQGEVIGIIGRNGAGKSTLLKILARITEPTKGRTIVRGRVGSLLEVGTGFHPELTGRENAYLNGTILGMRKAEIDRKFDEIVAFSEVEKFIDTPVKRYSSGMRVRLAFAVAAHLQPEVLLVDEVLAVGDAAFQKKCLGKMREVGKDGRTVLFVSHRLASVRKLCKRVYWLDAGGIKEHGLSNEVVNSYERETIYADLISSHQECRLVNEEEGIEIRGVRISVDSEKKMPTLRVEVQGSTFHPIRQLGIGLQLRTLDGVLVSRLSPQFAHSTLENIDGRWEGVFEVKDITHHLSGGDYILQVWVKKPKMGVLLSTENAGIVHVPETDIYNAGTYLSVERHGVVPLPVKFYARTD